MAPLPFFSRYRVIYRAQRRSWTFLVIYATISIGSHPASKSLVSRIQNQRPSSSKKVINKLVPFQSQISRAINSSYFNLHISSTVPII